MKISYLLLLMLICKIKFTRLQRHWKDFPIQQDKTSSNGKPPPPPAKKSGADQSVCSKCHDMFRLSDKELAQTKNIKTFCIRLLQVKRCMKKIKKTHSFCNGIGLMTLSTGVHLKRQYHRCSGISGISASSKSTIFKENRKNTKPQCRYIQANQNLSEPRHCGMFGDPHLRTFFDVRQTCVVAGAWSLLDNDILAVQVTNEVVQETVSESATATTKVSVIFKEVDSACITQRIYEATSKHLPSIFKDSTTFSGPESCRTKIFKHDTDLTRIESCHANTTLIIRKIGNYLSVSIKTPYEFANKSRGLCYSGCPLQEVVDTSAYFKNNLNHVSVKNEEAKKICTEANLTDFYFDSCVFDVLTTGDKRFVSAANGSMMDAISLDPKLRLRRENSVVLNVERQISGARTLKPSHIFLVVLSILIILQR